MESIDLKKAAAVWQRVQGNTPQASPLPDIHALADMIAEEHADATAYLSLSRKFQGKDSAFLRQMAQQEQSHAACLRGIYTLLTGRQPRIHTPPAPQESVDVLLRRCYGREMRCLAQYENRTADPQYGPVFSRLAQQEREHCRQVLELLGKISHR